MRKDYVQHAVLCAATSVAVVGLHLLALKYSVWAAAFAGGSAMAIGYELLQMYRKEGEPSYQDALWGIVGAAFISLLGYSLFTSLRL
jgi:hypothetical protein